MNIDEVMAFCSTLYTRHKALISVADVGYEKARLATNELIAEHSPVRIGDVVIMPDRRYSAHRGKQLRVTLVGYYPLQGVRPRIRLPDVPRVYGVLLRKDGSDGKIQASAPLKHFLKKEA